MGPVREELIAIEEAEEAYAETENRPTLSTESVASLG